MAGERTITLTRSATIAGIAIGGAAETVQADTQIAYQETVATGAINYELDIPITVANIQISAVASSQDITMYTNAASTGSPTQTIAVKKNAPLIWTINEPVGGKTFTADVTKIYFTNASGLDATVSIGFGLHQAPTGPS